MQCSDTLSQINDDNLSSNGTLNISDSKVKILDSNGTLEANYIISNLLKINGNSEIANSKIEEIIFIKNSNISKIVSNSNGKEGSKIYNCQSRIENIKFKKQKVAYSSLKTIIIK